jgi:hypothetical protein
MSKHNRCDISVEQPTRVRAGDQPEDSEGARYQPKSLLLRANEVIQ